MHFEGLVAYMIEIMYGGCKNKQCVLCVSSYVMNMPLGPLGT